FCSSGAQNQDSRSRIRRDLTGDGGGPRATAIAAGAGAAPGAHAQPHRPLFFTLRADAVIGRDVFRGISTILLVYLLGFGDPARTNCSASRGSRPHVPSCSG
ncbi:MAG: hypothetical protein WCK40_09615, partial [Thermoleophilia bacterium]